MKKKKSRLKKRIVKQFNFANFSIIVLSVLVSFCTVSFCNSLQEQQIVHSNQTDIASYAARLADSFEIYNEKRFAQ